MLRLTSVTKDYKVADTSVRALNEISLSFRKNEFVSVLGLSLIHIFCIARALLKNPKILILDDSTSAVDTKTDAKIRKAFREFLPETTKFIIAQRTSRCV